MVLGNGAGYVIGEARLELWDISKELASAGIDSLYSIYDAPSLGGLLVVTKEPRLFVRADGAGRARCDRPQD